MAFSLKGLTCLVSCLLLMPVNWGLEAVKWKIITAPVEEITHGIARRSVYSGVCLGNFAPGRATEFIAKILYFDIDNRSKVTLLHFINGMFQFSVTVTIGFLAILIRLKDFENDYSWMVYLGGLVGLIMLSVLTLSVFYIDRILHFVVRKINKKNKLKAFTYNFKAKTVIKLLGYSLLRYAVFFTQFALVLTIFLTGQSLIPILTGISIYFLITATIPMFSLVEAAIRAAVALVVFKGAGMSDAIIALCTLLIWIINIILPSMAGYYFLVKEKFNFRFQGLK